MKHVKTTQQNIIDQLHEKGVYDTQGKSTKKLAQQLALLQIRVESDANRWF